MSQARQWCFTLHADSDDVATLWSAGTSEHPPLESWYTAEKLRYMCYQVERCPDTGRVHIQGFVCLTDKCRLAFLRRHYSDTAHWEHSRGTFEQNYDYCTKTDSRISGPYEYGTKPQGPAATKRRWDDVLTALKAGKTRSDIIIEQPQLAPQARGIDAIAEALRPAPALERTLTVYYLSGPTGVGKTHHALHRYPNAFLIRGKYMEGRSFDQYEMQKELILDEWSPFEWPLTLMNSILDKWKCPLSCRYYNKHAYWETVVICSNIPLEDCYRAVIGDQTLSFRRRINRMVHLTERVESLDWDGPVIPISD